MESMKLWFAAPSVSVAGSRPGQLPAYPAPSRTVSEPPDFDPVLVVGLLPEEPQPARTTAATVATMTADARGADSHALRRRHILGLTSMLPLIRCSRYGQAPAPAALTWLPGMRGLL